MTALVLLAALAAGRLALVCAVGRGRLADELFKLPLALPLGVALLGLARYACIGVAGAAPPGVELALLLPLAYGAWRRWGVRLDPTPEERARWPRVVAACVLAAGLVAFVVAVGARFAYQPDGEWDAWAFWNSRARFIVRSPEGWERAFTALHPDLHPRYPPLHTMSVAWAWTLAGHEDPLLSFVIGVAFGLGSVAAVGLGVARLRGATLGLVAASALACAPGFVLHSASQYADVPVAFHLCAALVYLALAEREGRAGWLVLAGLSLGLAALTKNEGLLFALALLAGRAVLLRLPARRSALAVAAGALPGAIAWAAFRALHAPRGGTSEDFFAPSGSRPLASLLAHLERQGGDPARWRGVADAWARYLPELGGYAEVPLALALAAGLALAGWSSAPAPRALRAGVVALVVHLAVVSLAFVLLSTWRIEDHVPALERLLLQVLPAILFVAFAGAAPDRLRAAREG